VSTNPFKGYEWEELAEYWAKKYSARELDPAPYEEEVEGETELLAVLRKFIESGSDDKERLAELAQDVRLFLEALEQEAEKIDYSAPIWHGLRQVEDDYTLLNFTHALLPYMWT
jgi:hypothetical protein